MVLFSTPTYLKPRYVQLLKFRLVHMTTVSVGIVLVTKRAQVWFLWGVICFLVPFVLASLETLVCHVTSNDKLNDDEPLIY